MSLHTKILKVMKEIDYLKKDGKVDYGNTNYSYLSEEKITTAVRKAMIKHGLVIMPCDMEMQTEKTGKYLLTKLVAEYKIVDVESGESELICTVGQGMDSGDKGAGKAMTYAYKYAQRELFMIPTGDDPDHTSSEELNPGKEFHVPEQMAKALKEQLKEVGGDEEKFMKYVGFSDWKKITYDQHEKGLRAIADKKGEQK